MLWEDFDRQDGPGAVTALRRLGRTLHLDEIVYGNKAILYDGPGDFQLMEREAIIRMGGFDEAMILGWHVDANLSRRMSLLYGKISGLQNDVFAYHCDHTREPTPAHKADRDQNNAEIYVDGIDRPDSTKNAPDWGLANDDIEEIQLHISQGARFEADVSPQLGGPLEKPYEAAYATETFGQVQSDMRHTLPHLADLLSAWRRDTQLVWLGMREEYRTRFAEIWRNFGFINPPQWIDLAKPEAERAAMGETIEGPANVFVFDFGHAGKTPPESLRTQMALWVRALHKSELTRATMGEAPRLAIAIDTVHTRFEDFFASHFNVTLTPFSTRLRYGHAKPLPLPGDWMAGGKLGPAGRWTADAVAAEMVPEAYVYECKGVRLPSGHHQVDVQLSGGEALQRKDLSEIQAFVELTWNGKLRWVWSIDGEAIKRGSGRIQFTVSDDDVDDPFAEGTLRVRTTGQSAFVLNGLRMAGSGTLNEPDVGILPQGVAGLDNLVPALRVGPTGRRNGSTIASDAGTDGHLAFGPYWILSPGKYTADFEIQLGTGYSGFEKTLVLEAVAGDRYLAQMEVNRDNYKPRMQLTFVLHQDLARETVEFRVWTSGRASAVLSGLKVKSARKDI
jgi:hypothetical protein